MQTIYEKYLDLHYGFQQRNHNYYVQSWCEKYIFTQIPKTLIISRPVNPDINSNNATSKRNFNATMIMTVIHIECLFSIPHYEIIMLLYKMKR